MKTIVLKTIPLIVKGQEEKFIYREQLISIISTPSDQQRGADFAEIHSSLRVLDALDKVNNEATTLALEDADFEYMKQKVTGARFISIIKELEQFKEDVTTPLKEDIPQS